MAPELSNPIDGPFSAHKQAFILMAEDNPCDAELFSSMLNEASQGNYSVVCVDSLKETLAALDSKTYNALILDLNLPDSTGISKLDQLTQDYPNLPIIILTGEDNAEQACKTLRMGVQDYLTKNELTPAIFLRALYYATERKLIELQLKQALEKTACENRELESIAKKDSLTGLPNRVFFHDTVKTALRHAERQRKSLAVLYFDLNGFKVINDTYGHSAGDVVLNQIARRVKQSLRKSDTLARLGGDEFVVLTGFIDDGVQAYSVAQKICLASAMPIQIDKSFIQVSASVGIATYPESQTVEELLSHSDLAMYEAKKLPDHSIRFYTSRLEAKHRRRRSIEKYLPESLKKSQITTLLQPVIHLANSRYVSFDVTSQWHSDEIGTVEPDEFLPIAESVGLLDQVIGKEISDCASFFESFSSSYNSSFKMSIRVSYRQLIRKGFVQDFLGWVRQQALPLPNVCVSFTDKQLNEVINHAKKPLCQLKENGVGLELYDYGVGNAPLTSLCLIPLDFIKVSESLIHQIDHAPENQALICGLMAMSQYLGIQVIADGVRSEGELKALKTLGCHLVQGQMICQPRAVSEWIQTDHHKLLCFKALQKIINRKNYQRPGWF